MSDPILRKAREIILARTEGEISLRQKRMFNLLLYRAMKAGCSQAGEGGIHRISVSEMMEYVGGQSLESLEEILRSLSSASLTMDYVDDDGVRHTSRVHYISYHMTHSEDGWVYFAFDALLMKFIYVPRVYALLSMSDMHSFKTVYGNELYEIMGLRVRKQFDREWEVGIDEFRQRMRIKETDYTRFDNLRARVIEPAVDEINEIAHFRLDVEYRRGGRGGKVMSMIFRPVLKGLSILDGRDAALGLSGRKASGKATDASGDLFGYSEGEITGGITEEALQAAGRLLQGGDPLPLIEEWKTAMAGRKIRRPDKSFLGWLEARVSTASGGQLEGMDMDSVDALFSSWIENSDAP